MRTERTNVHRLPQKQVFDTYVVRTILARAILAHVAISVEGQPYSLPLVCAPFADELLLHGSNASRLFKVLSSGAPACVSITLVDGLVLARSAFESSMHYHSLIALGSARVIQENEKEAALLALTGHLFPERGKELRASTEQELRATSLLAFPLTEVSVKVSSGPVDDPEADLQSDVWAGIVPITSSYGEPIASQDLKSGIEIPDYISGWPKNRT